MAVLIEAISVVFRKSAIEDKFSGGWPAFLDQAPNRTIFSDGVIGCIGFMHPDDVRKYVLYLESCGLDFNVRNRTKDVSVVDQIRGFTIPSPWLNFGEMDKDGNRVKACWLADSEPGFVFTRRGWRFEGSFSQKSGYVASEDFDKKVKYLRNENGLEVYFDLETGKEVYLSRPEIKSEDKQDVFERLCEIRNDVHSLEADAERARQSSEVEKRGIIFSRLANEILPELATISGGVGRRMSYSHIVHGLVLRALKDLPGAEVCFRRAYEIDPDDSHTLLELVRCLGEQGKHAQALPFARDAVTADPENAGCLANLSMVLLLNRKKDEARGYIEKAIEIDPDDPINLQIYSNFEK